jgi:putative methionine-R-sulfoxide reductase with GAF domain
MKQRSPAGGRALSISPDLRVAGRVKKTAVEKAFAAAAGAAFRECLPRLKDDKALGVADIDAPK